MPENKIELKSIRELMGMSFFIPSYQRGYRWTKQQVEDLLNDIYSFKEDWYSLQPLVVKKISFNIIEKIRDIVNGSTLSLTAENDIKDALKGDWEVIDGQQRLTTIFLILKCLDNKENDSFKIDYETRKDTSKKLNEADIFQSNSGDAKNIDEQFIFEAIATIQKFKESIESNKLLDRLKDKCKVIWYEIGKEKDGEQDKKTAYETFKRLNSGKIGLSNAELIKAIILNPDNFETQTQKERELIQIEISGEWDRIEQALHDDAFWYFINPEPENKRFEATRIDFIFELLLRNVNDKRKRYYNKDNKRYEEERNKNPYYAFLEFNEFIISDRSNLEKTNAELLWEDVQYYFRTIRNWFDNRKLYHFVGYLMNLKGKDVTAKFEILSYLLEFSSHHDKPEFEKELKNACEKTILYQKELLDVDRLEYKRDNDKIHNILLLFNIASVQNQLSEQGRYPFDFHTKEKWSLEHIHAQNERRANWTEKEIVDIRKLLTLKIKDDISGDLIAFIEQLSIETIKEESIYNCVIQLFEGARLIKKIEGNGNFSFDTEKDIKNTFDYDLSIKNLALLPGNKNSQLNNKLYHEKRKILSGYEGYDGEKVQFIPLCTRNVFFKHYSPDSVNPFFWESEDGDNYFKVMISSIAKFLNIEELIDEDNRLIGLKEKETKNE